MKEEEVVIQEKREKELSLKTVKDLESEGTVGMMDKCMDWLDQEAGKEMVLKEK